MRTAGEREPREDQMCANDETIRQAIGDRDYLAALEASVLVGKILRQMCPRHEVKTEELHLNKTSWRIGHVTRLPQHADWEPVKATQRRPYDVGGISRPGNSVLRQGVIL